LIGRNFAAAEPKGHDHLSVSYRRSSIVSVTTDTAHRRAEALFKKEQQLRDAHQAMAEYQAELNAMREKTARLRALRLARDATNHKLAGDAANHEKRRPVKRKGAA
jgi:alkanesulfonate monooxygenase SsuD/methylene tetrahydromethanopterin reductase-like flavin-dependent oxidoreductase (luciferase family)